MEFVLNRVTPVTRLSDCENNKFSKERESVMRLRPDETRKVPLPLLRQGYSAPSRFRPSIPRDEAHHCYHYQVTNDKTLSAERRFNKNSSWLPLRVPPLKAAHPRRFRETRAQDPDPDLPLSIKDSKTCSKRSEGVSASVYCKPTSIMCKFRDGNSFASFTVVTRVVSTRRIMRPFLSSLWLAFSRSHCIPIRERMRSGLGTQEPEIFYVWT